MTTATETLEEFRRMVPGLVANGDFVCDVYLSDTGVYVPCVFLKHHAVSGGLPAKYIYVLPQGERFRIYMQGIYIVVGLIFPTRCLPWSVPYDLVGSTIMDIWNRWLASHPSDAP